VRKPKLRLLGQTILLLPALFRQADTQAISATPGGTVSVLAGTRQRCFLGDGGPTTSASLAGPTRIALDASGGIYIVDSSSSRVRKVTPDGKILTVAGNGNRNSSGDGGPRPWIKCSRPVPGAE